MKYPTSVTAKCPACGYTQEFGPNEMDDEDYPCCPDDGMPLIAVRATAKLPPQ